MIYFTIILLTLLLFYNRSTKIYRYRPVRDKHGQTQRDIYGNLKVERHE